MKVEAEISEYCFTFFRILVSMLSMSESLNHHNSNLDDLTFRSMYGVLQGGMWLLNDLENYLRPFNMSQGRLSILLSLQDSKDGMIHPAGIAALTGKSRPTVSKMISRLVEDNYVQYRSDDSDGRSKRSELTEKGRSLLGSIVPGYNQRVRQMVSNISAHEKRMLIQIISKIDFLDPEKVLRKD